MTGKDKKVPRLDRLADMLIDDLSATSNAELAVEAAEDGVVKPALEFDRILENAISSAGRAKLASAREALQEARKNRTRSPIVSRSLAEKRLIVSKFGQSNRAFGAKLTLAARNATQGDVPEAEVDSLLEQLYSLGVIDDAGELK